jgi:hypothetical protein
MTQMYLIGFKKDQQTNLIDLLRLAAFFVDHLSQKLTAVLNDSPTNLFDVKPP